MQHLDLFELTPPFYYYAPHRIVNRDHARAYPLYDALRRRFGCDMNLDLNRLARSTPPARCRDCRAATRATSRRRRASPGALARRTDHHLLAGRLPGVQGLFGRETRFITECLR
jgi:hypothetical protein